MVCGCFALNILALLALSVDFGAPSNANELPGGTLHPTPSPTPASKPAPPSPSNAPMSPSAHLNFSCRAIADVERWKREVLPCRPGNAEQDDWDQCRYGPPGLWVGLLICEVMTAVTNFLWLAAIWCSARGADNAVSQSSPPTSAQVAIAPVLVASVPAGSIAQRKSGKVVLPPVSDNAGAGASISISQPGPVSAQAMMHSSIRGAQEERSRGHSSFIWSDQ